ncbi:MAG: diguanylate cyclase [Rhodoluna sp.]
MKKPPVPYNEENRIDFLQRLHILDTPLEARFERITRLVCKALNVPIAAISLVDEDRQWFKSIQGLEVSETSRDVAFCAHAILGENPLVVSDATLDDRFKDNPLVTSAPTIRAYAGYPLDMGDCRKVGTLCAIDTKPREFDAEDLEILEDLAAMTRSELQNAALSQGYREMLDELNAAERAALIDHLTRLWNRAGGENLLTREWEIAQRNSTPVAIGILDIDHFKKVNDTYGHDVGDQVIVHVGKTVLTALRPYDIVCRWGGEEFLLICPGCDIADLPSTLDRVQQAIRKAPAKTSAGELAVTVSIGAMAANPNQNDSSESFIKLADEALYKAKKFGRDRFEIVE